MVRGVRPESSNSGPNESGMCLEDKYEHSSGHNCTHCTRGCLHPPSWREGEGDPKVTHGHPFSQLWHRHRCLFPMELRLYVTGRITTWCDFRHNLRAAAGKSRCSVTAPLWECFQPQRIDRRVRKRGWWIARWIRVGQCFVHHLLTDCRYVFGRNATIFRITLSFSNYQFLIPVASQIALTRHTIRGLHLFC